MDPDGRDSDTELLVVVRQSLVLGSVVLLLVAAGLSRHGSAVHLWLEGSWWLTATITTLGLFVAGIFELIVSQGVKGDIMTLQIVEVCEIGAYLVLAALANYGRTRQGRRYAFIRITFFVSTIFVVVLWSVSSLVDIVSSGWATPGTLITLTGTILTAVIMTADKCVIYWNRIDPLSVNARVSVMTLDTGAPGRKSGWGWGRSVLVKEDLERQPLLGESSLTSSQGMENVGTVKPPLVVKSSGSSDVVVRND